MKLKFIIGESNKTCKCGNWLAHWRKFSGHPLTYCPIDGCREEIEVGAHVKKYGTSDGNHYIIPLCKTHCEKSGIIDPPEWVKLVSVDIGETCGSSLSNL